MRKVDYRAQIGNFAYWRNVANEGRGSQMTKCLHEACDYAVKLETDRAELVEASHSLLTALSAQRANPVFANIVDQRADDLAALLARLEAE